MAERDAFGNELGGGTPTPIPGPTPAGVPSWTPPPDLPGGDDTPAAVTPPPPAPAATWTPPPTTATPSNLPPVRLSNTAANRSVGGGRGRSGMSVVVALIIAAVIIGVPVLLIAKSSNDASNDIKNAFNSPSSPTPSSTTSSNGAPTPQAPSTPPTGLATGSMMLPAALSKYIKDDLPGNGKLVMLRVAPENLQAETRTASGGTHHIYLDYAGTNQVVKLGNTGGFGTQKTIPLSKIDPQAPARMIKHVPRHTKSINYLVLDYDFNGKLQWLAYYKNSNHFYSADAHGRHVHQVS